MRNNILSIIIAFRNENAELITTIQEIRSTVKDSVDIVVVDDASDDKFDYIYNLSKYEVYYLKNKERLGCAPSRDIGIQYCKTPYFFIIDAHMRFYDTQWASRIIEAIKHDERAIYCCKCIPLDYKTKQNTHRPVGNGAYMCFFQPKMRSILELSWIKPNAIPKEETYINIPCILGACYASNKKYWQYLKGLEGLTNYSCDEQYISLKVWMEGGKCILIPDIKIGHLFRDTPPYEIKQTEFYYNKLIIIKTLLPEYLQIKMIRAMKAINYTEYVRASELQKQNEQEILHLKDYYASIMKDGFDKFIQINNYYREIYNESTIL